MGRLVLLTAVPAALALAGCAPQTPPGTEGGDPHADLTCASCHEYTLATQTQLAVEQLVDPDSISTHAPVPRERCTTSGCHPDAGPREVQFRSVAFEHRQHGGDTVVAMGCVGCHSHDQGGEPLRATVDPCSLCHLSEQSAGNEGECRLCHTSLEHAGVTSQGLSVPHEGLPWLDGGCVRCHFDVTRAPTHVSVLSCRGCHTDEEEMVARGIGEDLHISHLTVGCHSCHEGEGHRIRAMSSAVDLECSQCHREVHAVAVSSSWPGAGTCNSCHDSTHLLQQRMVLGLVPGAAGAQPSGKFLAGLTCRSCHQPLPSVALSEPVDGSADSCAGCHLDEYRTVLRWWREGSTTRIRRVSSAIDVAAGRVSGPEDAVARLDSARLLVEVIREGRPEHNLPLAHQMLVRASDQINEAYVLAGLTPPSPPQLGREPRMGLCSYCHYRADDPWLFTEMSGSFHREALGIR